MTTELSVEIAAVPQDLFALVHDYSRRCEWDPLARSAELLDGARSAGLGVRDRIVTHNGLRLESEYIAFDPPHVSAVKLVRGPWLLASYLGSWRFDELAPGRTRVTYSFQLRTRPALLSRLLTPKLVQLFSDQTSERLEALKIAVQERGVPEDQRG